MIYKRKIVFIFLVKEKKAQFFISHVLYIKYIKITYNTSEEEWSRGSGGPSQQCQSTDTKEPLP